jgi:hypothetical protein
MNTPEILPQPASTYRLLLDAARTWPDSVATQWIPDPGDYTRCLAWTYADLAGTMTQIANALSPAERYPPSRSPSWPSGACATACSRWRVWRS